MLYLVVETVCEGEGKILFNACYLHTRMNYRSVLFTVHYNNHTLPTIQNKQLYWCDIDV